MKNVAINALHTYLSLSYLPERKFQAGSLAAILDAEPEDYLFERNFTFKAHCTEPTDDLHWLDYQNRLVSTQLRRRRLTCLFTNAQLLGENATAVTQEGYIITQNAFSNPRYFKSSGDVREVLLSKFRKPTTGIDCAISLVTTLSCNYFHWLLDLVSKLSNYKKIRDLLGEPVKVLVPPQPIPFITRSLELLEIPTSDIVPWDQRTCLVNRLVVPGSWGTWPDVIRGVPLVYPKENFKLLDKIKAVATQSTPTAIRSPSRIYIEREDQSSRQFVNRKEVSRYFIDRGFVAVYLASLDLESQVRLFSQADIVVAVHGAALTNIVWCKPSTTIIEFIPRQWDLKKENFFFQLSRNYGLNHHLFITAVDSHCNLIVEKTIFDAIDQLVKSP